MTDDLKARAEQVRITLAARVVSVSPSMRATSSAQSELETFDEITSLVSEQAQQIATLTQERDEYKMVAEAAEQAEMRYLKDCTAAEAQRDEAREELKFIQGGKSPCGHWGAHAVSGDGGKHITCLECDLASLTEQIAGLVEGMRGYANVLETTTFRSKGSHYDDFGAGEEQRAQRCAEKIAGFAATLARLGADFEEGGKYWTINQQRPDPPKAKP